MKEAFFRGWLEYFEWNSEEPDTFPWQARETLSPLERMRIAKSIAAFQLGEHSEGSALIGFAQAYGDRMGFAKACEHKLGALRAQRAGDGEADAGGRSRHQRALSGKEHSRLHSLVD